MIDWIFQISICIKINFFFFFKTYVFKVFDKKNLPHFCYTISFLKKQYAPLKHMLYGNIEFSKFLEFFIS